jgi:hypothetical protein
MIIHKATYGDVDCTNIVRSKATNNKLVIRSSNELIGDVNPGVIKYLIVSGEIDGLEFTEIAQEGDLINIPKFNTNKLGVFYSNNNNQIIWPSIYKSLNTIKLASEGIADIVTCMWEPLPNNPFYQINSWYKSQSHLNQLLQIMQCLYSAREMGKYEYVSFLEHDVMYPKGYFNYPEFDSGIVYTNMNYGGLNIDGWQKRNQNDEPFHQMTMRFDDAIKHCEYILPNALVTNSGMIETQTMKRMQWGSANEAIHINHGHHFTSHNSIYKKENPSKHHEYWGNHDDYLYLFK